MLKETESEKVFKGILADSASHASCLTVSLRVTDEFSLELVVWGVKPAKSP